MSAAYKNNKGFTLVELSGAVVTGGILLLTFFSLMVYSHIETGNINERARGISDLVVADKLFSDLKLGYPIDSIKIYADDASESSGSNNTIGKILVANNGSGETIRISGTGSKLSYSYNNGTDIIEFDQPLTDIEFRKTTNAASGKQSLIINLSLYADRDTLNSNWTYAVRN